MCRIFSEIRLKKNLPTITSQEATRNCVPPKTKQHEIEEKRAPVQEWGEGHPSKSVKKDTPGQGLGKPWVNGRSENGKLLLSSRKPKVEPKGKGNHSILHGLATNKIYIDIIM